MRFPARFVPFAAAAAIVLTGCGPATYPVRTYNMGEKVTLGHIIYTVFETQWLTQAGALPDIHIPQNRYFLVRINASNSGGSDLIVPNVSVVDDRGTSYPELDRGDGIPQWIGYLRTVSPAEAAAGNLVFDCPPGHYKLKVTDEDGERTAYVDIPLNFTSETPEMPVPGQDGKKKSEDGHTLLPGGRQ